MPKRARPPTAEEAPAPPLEPSVPPAPPNRASAPSSKAPEKGGAAGPTRKWRQQHAVHNGMPAVIIRDTGEAIPVENLYLKQKHAEATGVPAPKFEECWICGSFEHRRRDCPKGARRDDGSLIQATVVCLACRRRGHRLADCPDRAAGALRPAAAPGGAGAGAALCYRCGEAHHLRDCPAPSRGGALPFAHCFVCVRSACAPPRPAASPPRPRLTPRPTPPPTPAGPYGAPGIRVPRKQKRRVPARRKLQGVRQHGAPCVRLPR